MSHEVLDVHGLKVAVVGPTGLQWKLTPAEKDQDQVLLEVEGQFKMAFIKQGDRVNIYYDHLLAMTGHITYNEYVVTRFAGTPHTLRNGSVLELKKNGQVNILTKGMLAHWITGLTSDMRKLRMAAQEQQHGHLANALSVWEETAASPDYLQPLGHAVYERVVEATGRRYKDRA